MRKKGFRMLVTALLLSLMIQSVGMTTAEAAEWQSNDTGWWYQEDDGNYPTNAWRNIDGTWYYFTNYGYMQTGWQYLNSNWYYLSGSGALQTGWFYTNDTWYYANSSGVMARNQRIGDYWVDASGKWDGVVLEHEHTEASRVTREPTCTTSGVEEIYCSECGEHIRDQRISALGHDGYYEITTPATDTTDGVQSSVCKRCHSVISTSRLPAGSNNVSEYQIDMGNGETTTVRGYYNHTYEDRVAELLNDYREENSQSRLTRVDGLYEPVAIRGREQAASFSHTRPNGKPFYSVLDKYYSCGENIAMGYGTPEHVMQGWKNSPGHNANMLSSSYGQIGISCFVGEHISENGYRSYTLYWVQLFA